MSKTELTPEEIAHGHAVAAGINRREAHDRRNEEFAHQLLNGEASPPDGERARQDGETAPPPRPEREILGAPASMLGHDAAPEPELTAPRVDLNALGITAMSTSMNIDTSLRRLCEAVERIAAAAEDTAQACATATAVVVKQERDARNAQERARERRETRERKESDDGTA